jgi:hypothetical protein
MTTHALYPAVSDDPITCCYLNVSATVRARAELELVTCVRCKDRLDKFPQLRNAMLQAAREIGGVK